jgi:Tol biopolymer transport system component
MATAEDAVGLQAAHTPITEGLPRVESAPIAQNLPLAESVPITEKDTVLGSNRYDWLIIAASTWFIGGAYLDGWAHNHLPNLETFFTPWHAVLYSGFLAVTAVLCFALLRNHAQGYPWLRAMPPGYNLSLLGAFIFALGGVSDMLWHILFGVEVSVEALLSPTHLLLAFGGILMISGPLRSAWLRFPGHSVPGWATLLPAVLSLTFILSQFAFFTQYAHPLVDTYASRDGANSFTLSNSDLYIMNVDGSMQTRLTNDQANYWRPVWSPKGDKIAFSSGPAGNQRLYVMNANGSNQMRLTNSNGNEWGPSWSPDGSKLAFVSNRDGTNRIYIINADGSNLVQVTKNSDGAPAWSPDGSKIAFNSSSNNDAQIYVINTDGSGLKRLTNDRFHDYRAAWSPDGKKIAFTSDRDGHIEVYVMNADGSHQRRLTNSKGGNTNWTTCWSPDGSKIVFVSYRNGNAQVYLMNSDGSQQVNLTNTSGTEDGSVGIAWSPDGKKLIYTSQVHALVTPYFTQALGLISILLQAALLMGCVLLLVRRWKLPFGTMTLIFTITSVLISFMQDQYFLLPGVVLAGIIADLLLWWLKPAAIRPLELRLFAFFVPLVFYSLYFLTLLLAVGIGWSVHLWGGVIVLTGVVGLLLSYLMVPPLTPIVQDESDVTAR